MDPDLHANDAALLLDENAEAGLHTQFRYGFKVSGLRWLQDPELPSQYSVVEQIFPLPDTKPWFKGLINQRNTLIPVYDLAALEDKKSPLKRQHSLLIVQIDLDFAGIVIDGLPEPILGDMESEEAAQTTDQAAEHWPELIRPAFIRSLQHAQARWDELSYPQLFRILAGRQL